MTMVQVKLGLLFVGLAIWAWGYRTDDATIRLVGIVMLLLAFLLRFVKPRKQTTPEGKDEPPGP
jgi:uncharacterized membrane protein